MSTRSNIRVILKEEDRNRDMMFAPNERQAADLAAKPWGPETLPAGEWKPVNPQGKEALMIYHHWDGYIEGVGETLFREYNTYDEALNLVLGGDCSSINGSYTPYAIREGEPWMSIKPKPVDAAHPMENEYDYMFRDGEWWVRGGYDEGCDDWTPLKGYMEQEKEG